MSQRMDQIWAGSSISLDHGAAALQRRPMFPFRDHNPSRRTPVVTYMLLATNIIVFAGYMALLTEPFALTAFFNEFGMVPLRITSGEGHHTLITSMFLHAGFMHIAGNMLFLWIFGDNLEDEMGPALFLGFYLMGGLLATLAQYYVAPYSNTPVVGASGAIAAVMGGYLLLYPKARVDVLIFIIVFVRVITIPAWAMLGVWFGLQLLNGVSQWGGSSGVAHWAHAGGFVAGVVLAMPVWMRLGGRAFWQRTLGAPDHAEATYKLSRSSVPRVQRRR